MRRIGFSAPAKKNGLIRTLSWGAVSLPRFFLRGFGSFVMSESIEKFFADSVIYIVISFDV